MMEAFGVVGVAQQFKRAGAVVKRCHFHAAVKEDGESSSSP